MKLEGAPPEVSLKGAVDGPDETEVAGMEVPPGLLEVVKEPVPDVPMGDDVDEMVLGLWPKVLDVPDVGVAVEPEDDVVKPLGPTPPDVVPVRKGLLLVVMPVPVEKDEDTKGSSFSVHGHHAT